MFHKMSYTFKMTLYQKLFLGITTLILSQTLVLATEKSAAFLCQKHIVRAEKKHNIPPGLLAAISIIESGKKAHGHEDLVAWPWVINVAGKPEYYKTKTDVLKSLNKHLESGKMNVDVGCMQVNYRHHGAEFRSPTYMIDPRRNVEYAAKFLTELRKQYGSWTKAVGHYHSATLKHQTPYRHKVYQKWQKVRHDQKRNKKEGPLLLTDMSEQAKRLLRPLNKNPATRKTGYEIIYPKKPAVFQKENNDSRGQQEQPLTVSALQDTRKSKARKPAKIKMQIPTLQQINAQDLNDLIYTPQKSKNNPQTRKPYFFKK